MIKVNWELSGLLCFQLAATETPSIFGTVHCYPYDGSSGKSISANMAAEYSSQRFWSLGLCLYIFDTVLVRFNKDPILMSPINIDYQRYLGIIYIVS